MKIEERVSLPLSTVEYFSGDEKRKKESKSKEYPIAKWLIVGEDEIAISTESLSEAIQKYSLEQLQEMVPILRAISHQMANSLSIVSIEQERNERIESEAYVFCLLVGSILATIHREIKKHDSEYKIEIEHDNKELIGNLLRELREIIQVQLDNDLFANSIIATLGSLSSSKINKLTNLLPWGQDLPDFNYKLMVATVVSLLDYNSPEAKKKMYGQV